MSSAVVVNSKQQVARGTVMTVMVISLMIIINIETIITMIWQHAGSLLPAGPCPRPNIVRAVSQPTGVLWPLAPLPLAALLSLRRVLPRLVALLRLRAVLLW